MGLIVMLLNNQQKGGGQYGGSTNEYVGVNCYVAQQSTKRSWTVFWKYICE